MEFFKKIVINSINDLPKEDIIIYGKYKNSVMLEHIEFHNDDLEWALNNLDWYLLPVSEEELQNELCIYPRIINKDEEGKKWSNQHMPSSDRKRGYKNDEDYRKHGRAT